MLSPIPALQLKSKAKIVSGTPAVFKKNINVAKMAIL